MASQHGFIIDTDRCVDCRSCVTACKARHRVELGVAWRSVRTTWKGSYPAVTFTALSMACNHCERPACVDVCPVGAVTKRPGDGIVVVDASACIGCQSCGKACPYGAPHYGKDGKMQKCTLCLDLVTAGRQPACVATCPAGALTSGPIDSLGALSGKKTLRRLEGATRPAVLVPLVRP